MSREIKERRGKFRISRYRSPAGPIRKKPTQKATAWFAMKQGWKKDSCLRKTKESPIGMSRLSLSLSLLSHLCSRKKW